MNRRLEPFRGLQTLALFIGLVSAAFLTVGVTKALARPNFVVVQTDDQTRALMTATFKKGNRNKPVMPNVRALMRQGTDFSNYYVSTPVCGPSRAALLSGQYPQNNQVIRNQGPAGGWEGWSNSHIYDSNLATVLQDSGYNTAHFGKLTNMYGERGKRGVPPGWDTWISDYTDD